jgi:ABC-type transporter Mla subunit MlaD
MVVLLLALLAMLCGLGQFHRRDQARWEASLRAVRQAQAMVRELADSLERLEYWNGQLLQGVAHQAHHPTAAATPPQYILEQVDHALVEQARLLQRLLTTLHRLHASLAQTQQEFWVHRGYRARSAQALAMLRTYHQALGVLETPLQEARDAMPSCCQYREQQHRNR